MRAPFAFPLAVSASASFDAEHASMIQPRHFMGVEADGENLLKLHRAPNACASCSECVAVPGNSQAASDSNCSPCKNGGQSWWPCNVAGLCQCAGGASPPSPPPSPPATTAAPVAPATTAAPATTVAPATTAAPVPSPPSPSGTGDKRCGANWASSENGQECPNGQDSDCPAGQKCFGGWSPSPTPPSPTPPSPTPPAPSPTPPPSGGATEACPATNPGGAECSYNANGDVASWFSLADFNNIFPNIGGHGNCAKGAQMLKYSCMIAAIQNINTNKNLQLFSSGNVADDKRELAAWFGIMAQETTGGTVHPSQTCISGGGGGASGGGGGASGGSTSTRCGINWASSVNGAACPNGIDSDCPAGQKCFGGHLLLETNSSANACTCSGANWCKGASGSGCLDWGLCWVEEQGCGSCPGYGGTAQSGHTYHGRGPKQLSWNYNYQAFSEYYCGDHTLLNYPERVASNSELAWASSIWFWVTGGPDNYKPGCHDVFTRTSSDGTRNPGLGWAINVVNGGLECASHVPRCDRRVASRVLHYKHYCAKFSVDPLKAGWTEIDNLYCKGQQAYR